MRIAVMGATGVVGAHAVTELVAAGHDVLALEATADHAGLVAAFADCDAVVNTGPAAPAGYHALLGSAWREHDRLRVDRARAVAAAARDARVRRLVQESSSLVYADQGDTWVDETSPLDINAATEPVCVGESHVQAYQSDLRQAVVLRFGVVVDDAPTWFLLAGALPSRTTGAGSGWMHLVHPDDIGLAVVAALGVHGGVYNVGAEPVRRAELRQAYVDVAGRDPWRLMRPVLRRLAGRRTEPVTRSLRVTSDHFRASAGWTPRRPRFDASWLQGGEIGTTVLR